MISWKELDKRAPLYIGAETGGYGRGKFATFEGDQGLIERLLRKGLITPPIYVWHIPLFGPSEEVDFTGYLESLGEKRRIK